MIQILVLLLFSFLWGNGDSKLEIESSGKKVAYKNHYLGILYFQKGEHKKALQHFQQAYTASPENFYFGTSYAISLSHSGKVDKGLKIMQQLRANLDLKGEDAQQELAFLYFFEGMANVYAAHFHQAVPALKESIALQETIGNNRLISLFQNVLGYAMLLNQGKGAHTKADIEPHYHVHTRDMVRALEYFEKALETNPSNKVAWHNYKIICDSLAITPKIALDSTAGYDDLFTASEASLIKLPASILSAFDFSSFNEVLLMLDNSGSMVQEKVQCQDTTRFMIMKQTAMELVKLMPDSVQIGIGTIGGDCPDPPRLWHKTGELSRRDLRYAIDFLVPDGTTPLLTMMERSPELFSNNPGTSKALFLVSDGANVCNAGGLDICEWVDEMAKSGIIIHILTFLNASFANTNAFAEYTCLADKTNGSILFLDDLRCNVKYYPNTLVQACQPQIPELKRLDCWGKSVENLWGIFPGQ